MAVKIRLTRTGAKNEPSFRVVATDSRTARDGRFIESLGWYDPKRDGDNYSLDMGRVEHWVANGAQVSDTVKSLVRRAKRAGQQAEAGAEAEAPVHETAAAD